MEKDKPEEPKYEKEDKVEPILTEEQGQEQYTKKMQDEFFDEDDEIMEINWD